AYVQEIDSDGNLLVLSSTVTGTPAIQLNQGVTMVAGVGSSTFFIGNTSSNTHYFFPKETTTVGQVLAVSSATTNELVFQNVSELEQQDLEDVLTQDNTADMSMNIQSQTISKSLRVDGKAELGWSTATDTLISLGSDDGDDLDINATISSDVGFRTDNFYDFGSSLRNLKNVYSRNIVSNDNLTLSSSSTAANNQLQFDLDGTVKAGVNSSSFFIGSDSNRYEFPSNNPGSTGYILEYTTTNSVTWVASPESLPTGTATGVVLRWDGSDWVESTAIRIAPGSGFTPSNTIWINQSITPSGTLTLGDDTNDFENVYTDSVESNTDSLTLTANSVSAYLEPDADDLITLDNVSIFKSGTESFTFTQAGGASIYLKRQSSYGTLELDDDASLASGVNNTAFGIAAIYPTTDGSFEYNTAIGYEAMSSSSLGDAQRNVAIGARSMADLNGGDDNTAIGAYSMQNIIGGNNNVGIGTYALNALTDGEANISIAKNQGALTTGDRNIAIGFSALDNNSTSNDNVAIGTEALSSTSSASNVAIGNYALRLTSTGAENVAIGTRAGRYNQTGSGNIFIGNDSGNNLSHTDGEDNIIIGSNARFSNSGIENSVAIGSGAVVVSSNTIYLGGSLTEKVITTGKVEAALGLQLGSSSTRYNFPTKIGSTGQVLTVSSTANQLYFADASGGSTTPTLDQVTTQGSVTTNDIEVGGLTVSGTTGLTIRNGSDRYILPTSEGTAGQSLIVSTTTSQLIFSSPYYLIADHATGEALTQGTEIGGFTVASNNGITISGGDTFNLPAGRIYECTGYIRLDSTSTDVDMTFTFEEGGSTTGVSGVTVRDGTSGLITQVPAKAIVDATSSAKTVILNISTLVVAANSDKGGTYVVIKEL
ncbi:MAG: beta strand repeat-containing protein, partial [Flavobacteriaceae bacterium]